MLESTVTDTNADQLRVQEPRLRCAKPIYAATVTTPTPTPDNPNPPETSLASETNSVIIATKKRI